MFATMPGFEYTTPPVVRSPSVSAMKAKGIFASKG
jgi:hypothetical protein